MTKCMREESNLRGTARDNVRTPRMTEVQSDPISPLQSQAVTGTEISQVPVMCFFKAMQYKHLRMA